MPVLDGMQPKSVLHYFETLCSIPHGSGNTKAVSDYCVEFAREHGLRYVQDELNNVIIFKAASAGYEDAPIVMLQGHLDMVCEKTADRQLDMAKEAISLRTDGQWIWADRTTLGGDDGIAVAMALAVLDDDTLPHPALEVILTVDEEIGMLGAAGLDCSPLQGRLLINVDSEVEGVLTVSCTGGLRAKCLLPLERESTDGVVCHLKIQGLKGGHSGVEINKGRANANVLMGRLLYGLYQEAVVRLLDLTGGMADNAITPSCEATLLVAPEDIRRVEAIAASYGRIFAKEYEVTDPGITVLFTEGRQASLPAVTLAATSRVISALMLLPNGVQRMSDDIPGLVQTSLNLGIVRLQEQLATLSFSVRSSVATEKTMLCNRLDCLATLLGGEVSYSGDYPAWEYKRESKLRDLVADVYERQIGKKPVIEAIHAGLECGIFCGKLPGLDCISIGPDLEHIHTPEERLNVASTERTWNLLCEVLARAKEL